MQASAVGKSRIHILHVSIKAIAGVQRENRRFINVVILFCPGTEGGEIAMLQHNAFGNTCGAGGIEHDKQVFIFGCRQFFTNILHIRNLSRHNPQVAVFIADDPAQFRCGDQHLCAAVLHHQVQPLRRIGRIQRQIGTAGFQYTQRTDRHIFATGDQHANDLLPLNATPAQMHSKAVGDFIQLLISILGFQIHHGGIIRVQSGLLTEKIDHRLFPVKGVFCLVEDVDLEPGGLIGQFNVVEIILCDEFSYCLFVGGYKSFHKGGTEQVTAVFHVIHETAVFDEHLQQNRFFGRVQLQWDALGMTATDLIKDKAVPLIGEQGVRLDGKAAADLREGIAVMIHGTQQQIPQAGEIFRRIAGQLGTHGQGLYQHRNRIDKPGVISAVIDSSKHGFIRVIVFCQQCAEHAHEEYVFGDPVLFAISAYRCGGVGGILRAMAVDAGAIPCHVRIEAGIPVAVAKLPVEEFLRFGIGIALDGLLIIQRSLITGVGFPLKRLTGIGPVDVL